MRVCALLLLAALALADGETPVALRVIERGSGGAVLVDRGSNDGLAVGDRVVLYPREGGTYEGEVSDVTGRSARVRLIDPSWVPEAGTRGEAYVPLERFAEPEKKPDPETPVQPEPEPEPESTESGETSASKWKNKDEGYTPDMALLAKVKPVRPEDRALRLSGRAYVIAALSESSTSDVGNDFFRVGTDLTIQNPFERGGQLRAQVEVDYLTKSDEATGTDILIPRFSYTWGGTRFRATRWEAGRFLQHGMPEFGFLDGVEYGVRRENGHRYGASLGFMPEPGEDFDSFGDFQFAGFYEYVSGVREELALSAGFQKTLHDGNADRDLLLLKGRYLPGKGWDLLGTLWIDFYTGKDVAKTASVEVTQALLAIGHTRPEGHGFRLTFRHQAFPDILRLGEFTPVSVAELTDGRTDRLTLEVWRQLSRRLEVRVVLTGWNDEEDSGGTGELGATIRDLLIEGLRGSLAGFATRAEFENAWGARGSLGIARGSASYDLFYELSHHHQRSFLDDLDDLIQHRIRLSASLALPRRFDLSIYGEAFFYDDEFSWTVGFQLQKRF